MPSARITLLGTQPEGARGSGLQKPSAVGSGLRLGFPIQRHNVLRRSAIAIVTIGRANAVAILRDFSRKPMRLRQRRNQVADQLGLANAARVAANRDQTARYGFSR